jgi:hypothetical protein
MFGFGQVWCCDFEFSTGPTGRPNVVCMVARESHSECQIRLWKRELHNLGAAPFDTGANSLFVTYSAGAEISCFVELGWRIPLNILDLYAEYLALTNGRRSKGSGTGLLLAMDHYGLGHLAPAEKDAMRALAMRGGPWTVEEQRDLSDYCAEDVDALCRLLPAMEPELAGRPKSEWLLRGAYMAAIQCVEMSGIPIDTPMLERIRAERLQIISRLVERLEERHHYGVFDGVHWRQGAFRVLTRKWGIRWPSTSSGLPAIRDDVFLAMIATHPHLPIRPLYECRRSIELLSKFEITAAPDGRSRCWLAPLRSESGRNQPSNSRYIFGAPSWLRHLIKPADGYGIAYLDWSAQEVAIAAGLSGDTRLIEDYLAGDIYIQIAIALGLAPPGATKATHPQERDRCKPILLGANYGQTPYGLSRKLRCSIEEAKDLHATFARTYPRFHSWRQSMVNGAARPSVYRTRLGWPWWSGRCSNIRTVMNHPAQAHGGDMMRLATVAAVEAGIEVCATVHDAVLIAAPLERLDEDIARTLTIMRRAGERVAGIPVRAGCETVARWPDRFIPDRGGSTWALVQQVLAEIKDDRDRARSNPEIGAAITGGVGAEIVTDSGA